MKKTGVILGSFITQFIIVGMLFTYGVLITEFERDFGWSRTILSAIGAAGWLAWGVLAIPGGYLNDKFGPRLVLGVNGLIFGIGFILLSYSSQIWHLFIIFIFFIGTGLSTHDISTLSTIAKWFGKRRGIMTSIAKLGTALGQMLLPPLIAILIINFGWRSAVLFLGTASSVGLLIAAMFMSLPKNCGKEGFKMNQTSFSSNSHFWVLAACQLFIFFAMFTTMTHIVPYGKDIGLSIEDSALLLSIIGFSSIFGRLAIGFLADRLGGKLTYILCIIPMAIALFGIATTESVLLIYLLLPLYGFSHGGHFTVAPFIIAENFGLEKLGAVFGKITFFGAIGAVTGPVFAGVIFDSTGNYKIAFYTVSIMVVLAAVLLLFIPSLQDQKKNIK
jgi:MFS family permease